MSNAWETTLDDVFTVLSGIDGGGNEEATAILAEEAFALLDEDDMLRIEEAALWGDSIHEQTAYAHEILKTILEEKEILIT